MVAKNNCGPLAAKGIIKRAGFTKQVPSEARFAYNYIIIKQLQAKEHPGPSLTLIIIMKFFFANCIGLMAVNKVAGSNRRSLKVPSQ